MKGEPYNVIWYTKTYDKINIDLPTYFSNYKYVKVKVKEVFAKLNYFDFLYLECENFNYDRIYQGSTDVNIRKYVLNLSSYLEGGKKLSSFKIPYKKEVNMRISYSMSQGNIVTPFAISFEFTPIN